MPEFLGNTADYCCQEHLFWSIRVLEVVILELKQICAANYLKAVSHQ